MVFDQYRAQRRELKEAKQEARREAELKGAAAYRESLEARKEKQREEMIKRAQKKARARARPASEKVKAVGKGAVKVGGMVYESAKETGKAIEARKPRVVYVGSTKRRKRKKRAPARRPPARYMPQPRMSQPQPYNAYGGMTRSSAAQCINGCHKKKRKPYNAWAGL